MSAKQTLQLSPEKTTIQFSGKGEVYSYTIVTDAPEGYDIQSPYVLAVVKLDEGPMVTTQLTDLEGPVGPIEIGMRVEMVTRKLRTEGPRGMIVYGYKFRPIL